MTTPILEVRGLVKEYPGVRALAGVDFDVRAGEVHCLVGPNGAGKSTLIKCVSGAVEPTAGEILIDGEPAATGDPSTALGNGIATIYQERDLVEDLTVADSIFLGHEPRRWGLLDRARMRRHASDLLRRLDHEAISPRAHVRDLRPAGQQVVSIARALSRHVRLLIMDEPSAILDDSEIETMFGLVRRLTAEGVGVVYISHRLDEIRRLGDRVTVLTDGVTVASGLPATTSADELVELMVGHKVAQLYPERPSRDGRVLLEVRGVRRLPDVRDVSFEVRAGEVLGIGGLVGAGRSELLRAIYGVDGRDAGEVLVDGRRLPPGRPDRAIAAGLGLAPEDRKSQALLLDWSLIKNVSLADISRFQRGLIRVRAERAAAEEQLRALRTVPDDGGRMARELSGGNQQKVVLARWLLRHCRVLLLDEPTRGVDVATKAELYRLVADLAAQGLGVVVVSSELEELCGFCTRILVMREGELVAEVDGAEATELELLRHAMPDTQEMLA
ncbi:MAG TPA: sugar ABC transporter ATP-binding protein [Acidimicrobiales bacterium]|jgi:ribose transport system ATP-binding protein|nr:sugar ABC transporter ATP-binding protein [Acidimicrobiales bacterium]